MSDYHTGSALLDELHSRRDVIRERMRPKADIAPVSPPATFPPLPKSNPKPLQDRLAEAEAMRGTLAIWKLKDMRRHILDSAADFGETMPAPPGFNPGAECPKTLSSVRKIVFIQTVVAAHFNLSRDEMLSHRQLKRIAVPRMIAMYLSKLLTPRSLPQIGLIFGGRHHTTVLNAVRSIEGLIAADLARAEDIMVLRRRLEG